MKPFEVGEDNVTSITFHTIHGYRLKKVCIVEQMKTKTKLHERWFCENEGLGNDLPWYVRVGAAKTGYKTFNAFFAAMGYFRMKPNLKTSF